ncbi:hypothetical protein VTJ83DRAFT_1383 [Remersonia thermophila]|uniref:Uncharacterized protein n=1 Tax=Remersonia thermophila TaxID=72144 RepID=A0ABR4DR08_9PEZI
MAPGGQCKIALVEAPRSIQHIMAHNTAAALETGIVGRPMTTKQIQREYRKRTKTKKMTREEEREWQRRIRRELEEEERKRKEEDERERRLKRAQTLRERKKARDKEMAMEKKKQGVPLVKVTASQNLITHFLGGKGTKREDAADAKAGGSLVVARESEEPEPAANEQDEVGNNNNNSSSSSSNNNAPGLMVDTQSRLPRPTRACLIQLREKRDAEATDLHRPGAEAKEETPEAMPGPDPPTRDGEQLKAAAAPDRRKRRRLAGGIRWVDADEPKESSSPLAAKHKAEEEHLAVPEVQEERKKSTRLMRGSELRKKPDAEQAKTSLALAEEETEEATKTVASPPPRRSQRMARVPEPPPASLRNPAFARPPRDNDEPLGSCRAQSASVQAGRDEQMVLATSSPSGGSPIVLARDALATSTMPSSGTRSTQAARVVSPVQERCSLHEPSLSSPETPRRRPALNFQRPAPEATPEPSSKPSSFLAPHRRSASSKKPSSRHAPVADRPSLEPERRPEEDMEPKKPAETPGPSDAGSALPTSTQLFVLNHLDDFFPSASQEARELAGDFPDIIPESPPARKPAREPLWGPTTTLSVSANPPPRPRRQQPAKQHQQQHQQQPPAQRPLANNPPPPKPAPRNPSTTAAHIKTTTPRQAPPAQPALSAARPVTAAGKPHISYHPPKPPTSPAPSFDLPPISTQDLFLSSQDLREIEAPIAKKPAEASASARGGGGRWSTPAPLGRPLGRQLAQSRASAALAPRTTVPARSASGDGRRAGCAKDRGRKLEDGSDKENVPPLGRGACELTASQEEYEDPELDRILFKEVDLGL